MNHTPQIEKAIRFAARKHHGQFRAESDPLPYITHLFSTALLVAEDGAEDDVVIAALLHDTLEDTAATREEIALAFGERAASLVMDVTEIKEREGQKIEWRARKKKYLAHLSDAPTEALLISIADKIHNIESKLEALAAGDRAVLRRMGGDPGRYLWFHGELAALASERLPEHRLTRRLLEAHGRECEDLTNI